MPERRGKPLMVFACGMSPHPVGAMSACGCEARVFTFIALLKALVSLQDSGLHTYIKTLHNYIYICNIISALSKKSNI